MNFENYDKFVFFDFETSGLKSKGDLQFPTQLCFIVTEAKSGAVIETYNEILQGATSLSPWVKENCPHVTMEKIKNGVPIEKAWKALLAHVSSSTVYIAHNAQFDWGIVLEFAESLVVPEGMQRLLHQRVLCTKEQSTNRCKIKKIGKSAFFPGYKWPTLKELSEHLNVEIHGALHDALTDVLVLKDCFYKGLAAKWWSKIPQYLEYHFVRTSRQ